MLTELASSERTSGRRRPGVTAGERSMQDRSITVLLDAARQGGEVEASDLFAAVYDELRKLARSNRRRWCGNETLNTTALIHESFLKLAGGDAVDWHNRTHFYATASRAMRHILINYAKKASAEKRGGGQASIPLNEDLPVSESTVEELLNLTDCLSQLEDDSPRRCRIVECRVFGGLSVKETAAALDISTATVKRDWQIAAATLRRSMLEGGEEPG